jgi:hypothetical protein
MIAKPVAVKALSPYIIWIKYDDNTQGEVDLSHLLSKDLFKIWKDSEFFHKVYIDKETNAVAWNQDI